MEESFWKQTYEKILIGMDSRIIATSTKTLVTQFYHYIFPHFTFL